MPKANFCQAIVILNRNGYALPAELSKRKLADNAERAGEVMGELLDSKDEKIKLAAAQFVITKVDGKPGSSRDVNVQGSVEHRMGSSYLEALQRLARAPKSPRNRIAAKIQEAKVINVTPADETERDARKERYVERRRTAGEQPTD